MEIHQPELEAQRVRITCPPSKASSPYPEKNFSQAGCKLSGNQMPHINQKPEVRDHISLCWVTVALAFGLCESQFPLLCNRNKTSTHPQEGTKDGMSHLAMTWLGRAQCEGINIRQSKSQGHKLE